VFFLFCLNIGFPGFFWYGSLCYLELGVSFCYTCRVFVKRRKEGGGEKLISYVLAPGRPRELKG
jgi:hypothetical protein